MPELFAIETDRLTLTWTTGLRRNPLITKEATGDPPGSLILRARRADLMFGPGTRRTDVPDGVAGDPSETVGPRLYEQTDNTVLVRSKDDAPVTLETRDPELTRGINSIERGRLLHGIVNFGSQVGLSEFVLRVGSEPEVSFVVEVFPSKLDYRSDYQQLLAEVQEILTALVLEYLRATFRLGATSRVGKPSQLEWLTILRHVAAELERAFATISQRPHRVLTHQPEFVRAEHVRRADATVRNAIRRERGAGRLQPLGELTRIRQYVPTTRPRATLDTPEHRWLAAQLIAIRRRLAALREREAQLESSPRRVATLRELDSLLTLISRLSRSEPMAATSGAPPAGFASLPLLRSPGYREAYQACLILSLGLRIEDGPMRLTLKDVHELYEYWCLLALLRVVSEETGVPVPVADLIRVEHQGVRVRLERGRSQSFPFRVSDQRALSVTFNRGIPTELALQRPDILVTVEDRDWPAVHLVLDAKYRLDATPQYLQTYGSPGPPDDAINALHRYRDAILEVGGADAGRRGRTVVQAAALFPYTESAPMQFRSSRLWTALDKVGIGAIPFLPTSTQYVRDWIRTHIDSGGWSMADRAIADRSYARAVTFRAAAYRPVLIGVLRSGQEATHLQWIRDQRLYYVPLLTAEREARQYATSSAAIYSPAALRSPGAVTHVAAVNAVDVVPRESIPSPWPAALDPAQLCVVFHLDELRMLPRPIVNVDTDGSGQRVSGHRWTTELALRRARTLSELLLETELEWRLYEELTVAKTPFAIRAGRPRVIEGRYMPGRAWFIAPTARSQYRGAAGFFVSASGTEEYYSSVQQVAERLRELH